MLKIDRSTEGGVVRLELSGRIEGDALAELRRTIDRETVAPTAIAIDLEELRLLSRDAVRFLVDCERAGMRVERPPTYIRKWMDTEQAAPRAGLRCREVRRLVMTDESAAVAHDVGARLRVPFRINGTERPLDIDLRSTLLDVLREQLQLTGTKKGCDHGTCGACTVIVDGQRVLACLTLAATCGGQDVRTIEGLAGGDALTPLQEAFLACDAYQCGFCTPGQIMSAVACLDEVRAGVPSHVTADVREQVTPESISVDEIRERMSGNLCRCGAYPNIVAAVQSVLAGESRR